MLLILLRALATPCLIDEPASALLLSLGEELGGIRAIIDQALATVSESTSGSYGIGTLQHLLPDPKSTVVDISEWISTSSLVRSGPDRRLLTPRDSTAGLHTCEEELASFCLAGSLAREPLEKGLLVLGGWVQSLIISSEIPTHQLLAGKPALAVIRTCVKVAAAHAQPGADRPKLLSAAHIAATQAIADGFKNGQWADVAARIVALSVSRTDHLEHMKVRRPPLMPPIALLSHPIANMSRVPCCALLGSDSLIASMDGSLRRLPGCGYSYMCLYAMAGISVISDRLCWGCGKGCRWRRG